MFGWLVIYIVWVTPDFLNLWVGTTLICFGKFSNTMLLRPHLFLLLLLELNLLPITDTRSSLRLCSAVTPHCSSLYIIWIFSFDLYLSSPILSFTISNLLFKSSVKLLLDILFFNTSMSLWYFFTDYTFIISIVSSILSFLFLFSRAY